MRKIFLQSVLCIGGKGEKAASGLVVKQRE